MEEFEVEAHFERYKGCVIVLADSYIRRLSSRKLNKSHRCKVSFITGGIETIELRTSGYLYIQLVRSAFTGALAFTSATHFGINI